jgi:hypothetical protein
MNMTEDENEKGLQEYDDSQRAIIAVEKQDYEEMIYNLCQEHGLVKRETLSNLVTALEKHPSTSDYETAEQYVYAVTQWAIEFKDAALAKANAV